jgi:8-oxo-dGTP diphosphatase
MKKDKEMITRVQVKIINANSNYLMIKRASNDGNRWELPGGGIDKNETFIQAVRREAKEETGLFITNIKLVKYEVKDIKIYTFEARTSSNEVVLSKEHQDYRWMEGGEENG